MATNGVYKTNAFNFKDQDWEDYTAHRPTYPQEVFDRIYAYHDAHKGNWKTALDVGAGNGIISRQLLYKFDHVTFSDVSEEYVNQARQSFSAVPSQKISFIKAGFADLPTARPSAEGVDLLVAATCLHFSDKDTVISDFAKVVKAGGTVALMQYSGCAIYPRTEPKGVEAFEAVYDKLMRSYAGQHGPHGANAPMGIMNSRLDCLDFDPSAWKDVKRLHSKFDINRAVASLDLPSVAPTAASKVRTDVETEGQLDEDIVSKEAGYEWIEGYFQSLWPALNPRVTCRHELDALKNVMEDRVVRVRWSFDLVLATRR